MKLLKIFITSVIFINISIFVYSNPKQGSKDIQFRLVELQKQANILGDDICKFWITKGIDTVNNSFYGTLNENGEPIAPFHKGLIAMTRHLWSFSTWYDLKNKDPEIENICHNLYRFIINNYYDPASGEFYWLVDETGKVADLKKRLYSQSFVIYGLSCYARVFNNHEAAEFVLNCFKAIDKRAHDPFFGGYDQTSEPDWVVKGANKETNTHIHLLESFTSLFELTKDTLVKKRLEELLQIVTFKICQPNGYAHLQFRADWSTVDRPVVSYGHDLETAWLIYEAAKALGKNTDSTIIQQIVKMASLSAIEGYDNKRGGYFYSGIPGKKVTDSKKVWWVQAEGILGLARLYIITKDEDWLNKLEKTMKWIELKQVNQNTGEWYWDINIRGKVVTTSNMATEWKVSYHNLRAMIFLNKWINKELLDK